jgi:hypothetical protein
VAVSVTHTFVSPVADESDPNEVGPDEWNAAHTVTGLGDLAEADDAGDVPFTPAGDIAATDVQAAIEELDGEKLANVVEDTSPSLGGDLDLNNSDITGTGNIDITGSVSIAGDLNIDDNTIIYDDGTQGTIFRLQTATQWTWHDATGTADRMVLDRATGDLTVGGDVLVGSGDKIDFNSGDVTITHVAASGSIVINADVDNNAADTVISLGVDGNGEALLSASAFYPGANDGSALGIVNTNAWSDLHLASGGVINWNNSDVTITHSSNALDVDGGVVDFGSTPTVNGSNILTAATGQPLDSLWRRHLRHNSEFSQSSLSCH